MILSDSRIREEKEKGTIKIEPWNDDCLGSNSYDCHLSENLAIYMPSEDDKVNFEWVKYLIENKLAASDIPGALQEASKITLDSKKHNKIYHFKIPHNGLILYPGIGYLGSTLEYTETLAHVPFIEGKSSSGRLFIDIHATAGKGDVGFKGHWTLEISVRYPVKIYHGMPVGQLIYYPVDGVVNNPYNKKPGAKYSEQGGMPVESMMFKNEF